MQQAADTGDAKPTVVVGDSSKKTASKRPLFILVLVVVVAAIIVGLLFGLKGSGSKFTTYTFTNSAGSQYKIKFYAKSAVKQYGFGSASSQAALVSPVLTSGGVPLAVTVGGFTGNVTKANASILNITKACSSTPGAKTTFSVPVKSLGTSATFCEQQGVYYFSYFGTGNSFYYIQIAPYDPQFSPTSTLFPAAEVRSAPSESDIKTIASSFQFISAVKTK